MRDGSFLPSTDKPPGESLPILEDTDARKVILLTPRGMPELGLGCTVSLFIPAGLLCLPFVLPNARVHEPWLLGGLLLLALVVPVWLIWWSRTVHDSETTLILETDCITLRRESFDQRTGELVETDDESVHLEPGSGMTDDEAALHESPNLLTLTIWGPTDCLKVSVPPNEFPWLRQQIHDWLQRQVFAKPDPSEQQVHDPSAVISAANRQEHLIRIAKISCAPPAA